MGGVGLGVGVDEQHPAPVLGGQQVGQVDGGGRLAHTALHVQNRKGSHGMYLPIRIPQMGTLFDFNARRK